MKNKVISGILWGFVVAYACETSNVTASRSIYSQKRTPLKIITRETPNIFEHLYFGIYNPMAFWRNSGVGPPELGILIGVFNRVVPKLSYCILTPEYQVVSCEPCTAD